MTPIAINGSVTNSLWVLNTNATALAVGHPEISIAGKQAFAGNAVGQFLPPTASTH
jgi:hypothetical protein